MFQKCATRSPHPSPSNVFLVLPSNKSNDFLLSHPCFSHSHPVSQADDLSNPFGQTSLSCQGSTEAADPSSALFQPPLISNHSQQTSFIMVSTGQPFPISDHYISSHAPPTQQVLPSQEYIHPLQQIQISYYPPYSILSPTSNINLSLMWWPVALNMVSSCLSHHSSPVYSP